MINIFRSKYAYTIRGMVYYNEGWFVEYQDKISQPLNWHEAVGTVLQLMGTLNDKAPVYWPETTQHKHEFIGERF